MANGPKYKQSRNSVTVPVIRRTVKNIIAVLEGGTMVHDQDLALQRQKKRPTQKSVWSLFFSIVQGEKRIISASLINQWFKLIQVFQFAQ
ncbi:hypothetical protein PU629_19285 [Pullulanibacillus sp. KACC 23026]|uniref:hypothetical protein n=1 Tax=Pullulanibacillus sp. KACC 23026 TaxID=3028315 RepID=UPI0023B0424C|nr:hypothetical protein [Pullulanibacillus sp. KACC 23026]WEG15041.1 hypothetical protein PU629_19285 [Pullulanibacillus sp. KACC 23026]